MPKITFTGVSLLCTVVHDNIEMTRITGILSQRNDGDFDFVQTHSPLPAKRNPRVYEGMRITITRKDDGTYQPNFRPMRMGKEFSFEEYAQEVCEELLEALQGFIGK